MGDHHSEFDLYDEVYDIVFEHFKSFHRQHLENLNLYRTVPQDNDELYVPFQIAVDRLIKAKEVGEQNALKMRNQRLGELNQLNALLKLLDTTELDALSVGLLKITAFNNGFKGQEIENMISSLEQLSKLVSDEKVRCQLRRVIEARSTELFAQKERYGRRNVVPEFVAEACRIIWFRFTGEIAADTFKSANENGVFEQSFPQFVDAVFKKLFSDEEILPSVRTALQKSADSAKTTIATLQKISDEGGMIQWVESADDEPIE